MIVLDTRFQNLFTSHLLAIDRTIRKSRENDSTQRIMSKNERPLIKGKTGPLKEVVVLSRQKFVSGNSTEGNGSISNIQFRQLVDSDKVRKKWKDKEKRMKKVGAE